MADKAAERQLSLTRESDGSVTVMIDAERQFVLGPEEWIEVVASSTPGGVSRDSLSMAAALHWGRA